jgi:hypothetical protein
MDMNAPVVNIVGENLLFQTRIESVFAKAGYSVRIVSSNGIPPEEETAWGAHVWIFDMDAGERWVSLLAEARQRSPSALMVAFGSHVETEAFRAAREAGADHVVARSRFVQLLPQLPGMADERGQDGG